MSVIEKFKIKTSNKIKMMKKFKYYKSKDKTIELDDVIDCIGTNKQGVSKIIVNQLII